MMRRSARNYADVGRWLFRSRFFAVLPTPFANEGAAPTRSAIPPVGPLCATLRRCSSRHPKCTGAEMALCWTGTMQLRRFHAAPEEQNLELDDFMRKKPRLLRNTADYGREMSRLMRDHSYSRIIDLFEEMKTREVAIDVQIYVAVMKAYSRKSNVAMVKRMFQDVVTSGLMPDKFLFTTLIYAYSITGEVDAAFEEFYAMQKDYAIQPDVLVYRTLISVCGSGKDVDRARRTFNELVDKFGGDVRSLNVLLAVYAENVDSATGETYLQECKDLMVLMRSMEIKPEVFTYVPLIKLCGKLGRSKDALRYLNESLSGDVTIVRPSFYFLIRSLADLELTDEELETHIVFCLDRMKQLNVELSYITFVGVIELYEKKGDMSKALGFLKKLCTNDMDGAGRSEKNFGAQLEIVRRLWENGTYSQEEAMTEVSEVVKTMKSLGISLTYRGYKTWLTMCLKASDVERALECWNDFTEGDHWPSIGMTESMIRLLLDHDRVDDAVQVLKVVQKNEQVTPTEGPYEAVLAHCAQKSDTEHAKTVHEYMKEAKVEPNEAIQEHLSALQLV